MSLYALVDCNNFFVSCERVFRPDLLEKPVAVLSNNDGCIVARSNEVKSLGIAMGVPLFKVKDIVRANDVQLFSANFELYGDMSQRIVQLLREETPLIEVYSIDECFIDLSELPGIDAGRWAERVKTRIWHEIGIPVSVGVASTKTLAKVASTYAKSHGNGVWVVRDDQTRAAMLAQLPIEDIWGVGRALAPKLRDKGVSYAGQLTAASDAWLRQQFTISGIKMVDELRGVSRIPFGDRHEQRKSIMRSRSFGHTVRAMHQLESAVATFAAQTASRLRAQQSICRGVTVVLTSARGDDRRYSVVSRTERLVEASAHTGELIAAALHALRIIYDEDMAYKKAAVMLVDIHDVDVWQLSMLHSPHETRERGVELMNTYDSLNTRFGKGTMWHASELRGKGTWHSKNERQSPRYTTRLGELPKLYR